MLSLSSLVLFLALHPAAAAAPQPLSEFLCPPADPGVPKGNLVIVVPVGESRHLPVTRYRNHALGPQGASTLSAERTAAGIKVTGVLPGWGYLHVFDQDLLRTGYRVLTVEASASAADIREAIGQDATQVLVGEVARQQTGGAHKGHNVLQVSFPKSRIGPVPYALSYNACLEPLEHGLGGAEVAPKEGMSGVGLISPKGSWYSGGFIGLKIDGKSVGMYRPRLTHRRLADREVSSVEWHAGAFDATLHFTALKGDDKLLITGEVSSADRIRRIEVELRCFPGGTSEPRDRFIVTPTREVKHKASPTLDPDEFWVLCCDAVRDLAKRPNGVGPCAFMFDPAEAEKATVRVSEYPVTATVTYPGNAGQFHLAVWELPKLTNAEALAKMQTLAAGLSVEQVKRMPGMRADPIKRVDAPPGTLVDDGEPCATIVLPESADAILDRAAEELQYYLHQMTGAVLPIVKDGKDIKGNRLLLGATRWTPEAAHELSPEGFHLRTVGQDLVVQGGGSYGVLYGAYALLEEHLGCRWFLPDPLAEVVPETKTIRLEALDDHQEPSFPMRWVASGDWGLRRRCNRVGDEYPPAFRISPGIYHSQSRLLPHGGNFETHPEFFALVKGKRSTSGQCKLCYNQPEVAARIAQTMREMLADDPGINLLSLSPTDGQLWCECERCRSWDEADVPRDQTMSRRSLLFYNNVLGDLAQTHPDQTVIVGSYNVYTLTPKDESIPKHDNLGVVICHYEDYCLAHPVNDPTCPRNVRYRQLIRDWQKLAKHVYFYEYYWKVNWFDLPWPIVHTIAADIPFFKSIGIDGVHSQYNPDCCWSVGHNHYVASKLLWDVNADVPALMDEFYQGLFGEASGPVRKYYERMEEVVAENPRHFPGGAMGNAGYVFTEKLIEELGGYLDEAESLAKTDKVKARVAKLRVSWEYTSRLMEYLRLRKQKAAVADPEQKREIGNRAVALLQALYDEVRTDRKRYAGIVSTSVVSSSSYMGKELARMKDQVARLQTAKPRFGLTIPLAEQWQFRLDPEDVGQQQAWFAVDAAVEGWSPIHVPGTWESQGYEFDGFAWYRTEVTVPKEETGKDLTLRFGAVDGDAWVYWNGKLLGEHKGWNEAFEFALPEKDIRTDAPNVLTVRVYDGANEGGIWKAVALGR